MNQYEDFLVKEVSNNQNIQALKQLSSQINKARLYIQSQPPNFDKIIQQYSESLEKRERLQSKLQQIQASNLGQVEQWEQANLSAQQEISNLLEQHKVLQTVSKEKQNQLDKIKLLFQAAVQRLSETRKGFSQYQQRILLLQKEIESKDRQIEFQKFIPVKYTKVVQQRTQTRPKQRQIFGQKQYQNDQKMVGLTGKTQQRMGDFQQLQSKLYGSYRSSTPKFAPHMGLFSDTQ